MNVKLPAAVKAKASSTKKKQIAVSWNKTTCSGYYVEVSTTSNFKKIQKTATIKKPATTKATISGLKSGQKYFVRVYSYGYKNNKTYRTVSKTVTVKKVK